MARSLYRSVTYGLDASLALADTVAGSGGRTDADSLAAALSYSGVRNGAFLTRLANARLFGLVAGRSGQVVLTDRGRRCLSDDAGGAQGGPGRSVLGGAALPPCPRGLLGPGARGRRRARHGARNAASGRIPSKCRTTARVLLESAGRAGLLRDGKVDLSLVRDPITNFTDSPADPGRWFAPSVRWLRSPHLRRATRHRRPRADKGGATVDDGTSARSAEHPSDEAAACGSTKERARPSATPTVAVLGIVLGVAACVALIGIPVGLLAASGPGPATRPSTQQHESQ